MGIQSINRQTQESAIQAKDILELINNHVWNNAQSVKNRLTDDRTYYFQSLRELKTALKWYNMLATCTPQKLQLVVDEVLIKDSNVHIKDSVCTYKLKPFSI